MGGNRNGSRKASLTAIGIATGRGAGEFCSSLFGKVTGRRTELRDTSANVGRPSGRWTPPERKSISYRFRRIPWPHVSRYPR